MTDTPGIHDSARVTGEAEREAMQACLDAACEKFNVRPLWWAKDALAEAMRTYAAQVRARTLEEAEELRRALKQIADGTWPGSSVRGYATSVLSRSLSPPPQTEVEEVGVAQFSDDFRNDFIREVRRKGITFVCPRKDRALRSNEFACPDCDCISPAARPPSPPPEADGWIPWQGGECPVAKDALVEVKFRAGAPAIGGAGNWLWNNWNSLTDIIAYRPAPLARRSSRRGGMAEGADHSGDALRDDL